MQTVEIFSGKLGGGHQGRGSKRNSCIPRNLRVPQEQASDKYTLTLSIAHKVLLHTFLPVPFGSLAELQLPFSPGLVVYWSSSYQEHIPQNLSVR